MATRATLEHKEGVWNADSFDASLKSIEFSEEQSVSIPFD